MPIRTVIQQYLSRFIFCVTCLTALVADPALGSHQLPFDLPPAATTWEAAADLPAPGQSWAVYGLLSEPGEVNFIRMDSTPSDLTVTLDMRVFRRTVYPDFAPTFAFIGKGLSQPAEMLPFLLPPGYGAVVRQYDGEDPSKREVIGAGTRSWWVGQSLEVTEIADPPAYVAVWDPKGRTGEYTMVYSLDPEPEEDAELVDRYKNPLPGDGNGDGSVDVTDAILALRVAVGLLPETARLFRALDVSPAREGVYMAGDGELTVADAIRLLRLTVGLDEGPFP